MTENMKKFLEEVSKQEVLAKKIDTVQTKEEIIEVAKGLGVTLTEEDFEENSGVRLSEEELEAVSGGSMCLLAGGSPSGCGCFVVGVAWHGDLICVGVGADTESW